MSKLFILHGWTYTTERWDRLLSLLHERNISYEFLKVPGLTDGTNPTWTLDQYVEWLNQITKGDTVMLYGHSNGGRISLAFAAKYPSHVERLMLEDSAGIPLDGWRLIKKNFFKKLSLAGQIFPKSEGLRKLFYRIIRENDYGRATPEMRQTIANLSSEDLSAVLHKITAPTLVIWGAEDQTTPLSAGKKINAGIRNSRLVVIPGARHSPHATHPDLVADLIEKELRT